VPTKQPSGKFVLATIEHKTVDDGVHCVLEHPNVTAVTTELANVNVAFYNEKILK